MKEIEELYRTEVKQLEAQVQFQLKMNQTILDSMPFVVLLLRPYTREIVFSNKKAKESGAVPGERCYSTWGQRNDPCPWCLAPEVWKNQESQHLIVSALGIVWDAYWFPVSDELYIHFAMEITEVKKAEEELRKSEKQVKKQKRSLDEKNLALHEILSQIGLEKKEIYKNIEFNINKLIIPVLNKMKTNDPTNEAYDLLHKQVEKLTSSFGINLTQKSAILTPREIEICTLIEGGMSNKEIARLLCISIKTVEDHRKSIRKKFGLTNSKINLGTYLKSVE